MGSHADATLSDAGDIIGDGKIVVLDPENWAGRPCPLLDYIDIGDQLREGDWLVLLYHRDCPGCQRAIEKLRSDASPAVIRRARRVALVEISARRRQAFGVHCQGAKIMRWEVCAAIRSGLSSRP